MSKETSLSAGPHANRRPIALFAAVMCLAAFLLMFRLGERPLRNPDEGRYAEIAREILQSGDWVKPTLYGVGYFRKPVLFYWLVAGSFKAFGASEFSARLVPALFGLFGVGAVFWFCRRFFGIGTAFTASLMLATNFWVLQTARYLVIDAVFSFFVVVSLFCFYLSRHLDARGGGWLFLSSLSMALAFLAKGFLALVLVLGPAGLYLLMTRSLLKELLRPRLLGALLIFFFAAAPWYWLMEKREPGFVLYFVGHENFSRFASTDFEHQEPWFYYFVALPLTLLPWSLYLKPLRESFEGLWRDELRDPRLFLLVSAFTMLLFFSLSRSKLPTYIVPCVPLFLVVIARSWTLWMERAPRLGAWETAAAALGAFGGILILIGGSLYASQHADKISPQTASALKVFGGVMLAGAVLCLRSIRRQSAKRLFFSLIGAMAALSLFFIPIIESVNERYTTKQFAEHLKTLLTPASEVYVFDYPGPFYDFAFYLEHEVQMVGLEGEFKHFEDRNAAQVFVQREPFLEGLRQGKPLYCLIRRSDFEEMDPQIRETLKVLRQDKRKVLFST